MDEMDKQIFAPLPKSKETEFDESMPKLSKIFDNLQKTFVRSYAQHNFLEAEANTFETLTKYINKIDDKRVKETSLDKALIEIILPELNICSFYFKGNIFYVINGIYGYPSGYWIFSDMDIQFFCQLKNHTLLTRFSQPNDAELFSILYWHRNKIKNAISTCLPLCPTHSHQVDALRLLAPAFINYYWAKLSHNINPIITTRKQIDFDQARSASFDLLKVNTHPETPAFDPYQYISTLTSDIKKTFHDNNHTRALQLLWGLSKGNLISLSKLHDMFANVYLGQEYTNAAMDAKVNTTIIRCKNIDTIYKFLTAIFNSTLAFSSLLTLQSYNNRTLIRPIHTEILVSDLEKHINSPSAIKAELLGTLVNISAHQGDDDLSILKNIASKKTVSLTGNGVFQNTKHEPYMHYIYITDQPVPPLSYDARMIELMGDIAGTEYLPTAQDAATIVLLSLFNFFYPTKDPQEYIDIIPPPKYNDYQDVIKEFIRIFFKDTTSSISQQSIASVKKENQGKALDDKLRLELARKLHITDLDYTINNDLKELYDIWKESDPDHIPDMNINKITIAIREIYDPLFYVKNSKAKSTLHPEAPPKNVRAAYGVSIDMKKVSAFKKRQESKHQESDMQEAFYSYYKDMIHNYCILQSEIFRPFVPFNQQKLKC